MFDLGTALDQWRTGLKEAEALSSGDIAELEGHLVEQMEGLRASGLSEEEAFWVGSHRLGDRDLLTREFAKVNPLQVWRSRALWMAIGALAFIGLSGLSSSAALYGTIVRLQYESSGIAILAMVLSVQFLALAAGILPLFLLANGRLIPVANWFHRRYRTRRAVVSDLAVLFVLVAALPASQWINFMVHVPAASYLHSGVLPSLIQSVLWSVVWPLCLVLIIYRAARLRYIKTTK